MSVISNVYGGEALSSRSLVSLVLVMMEAKQSGIPEVESSIHTCACFSIVSPDFVQLGKQLGIYVINIRIQEHSYNTLLKHMDIYKNMITCQSYFSHMGI